MLNFFDRGNAAMKFGKLVVVDQASSSPLYENLRAEVTKNCGIADEEDEPYTLIFSVFYFFIFTLKHNVFWSCL